MGCRIIEGHEMGSDRDVAVLYDSVTGTAFGPIFEHADEAEAFCRWLEADPSRHVHCPARINSITGGIVRARLSSDPRAYPVEVLHDRLAEFRKSVSERSLA